MTSSSTLHHCLTTVLLLLCTTLGATGCQSAGRQADSASSTAGLRHAGDPSLRAVQAQTLNRRAAELIREQRLDEAEAQLLEALKIDGDFGPARNNLGKVHFMRGNLYAAAWEFEYASQLMPSHPAPRNNLGLVMETVGRLDEAVSHFSDAYRLAGDDPEVIGNLVRAKLRAGHRSEEVSKLLSLLILKDQRPEWVQWARRWQATLGNQE